MTPILILAAGTSSRMRGADKLLQEVDGVPLLVRTARRAEASGYPVLVAIPGPSHPRYRALKHENVVCFDVPEAPEGIGGTLRGAVKRLPPCEAFMVMLADMPMIETSDITRLFDAYRNGSNARIVQATTEDGQPGHPIVFDARLRDRFENCAGDDGAKPIIAAHIGQTHRISLAGNRARFDLDTPDDWKNWDRLNESALSG